MHRIHIANSRQICWLYLFLGGFLAGIFFINIGQNFLPERIELLNLAAISRLKYLDINSNIFFGFVLKERLELIILLCLLATTYVGTAAINLYTVWMGIAAGIFLSDAAIHFGLKGILFVLAGITPQYFFLVPAFILLVNWCYLLCVRLYFPGKNYEGTFENKKQYMIRKLGQLIIIIGVVIIGSIVESYVNPIILKYFLKLF